MHNNKHVPPKGSIEDQLKKIDPKLDKALSDMFKKKPVVKVDDKKGKEK